jgi:hypothetical protein
MDNGEQGTVNGPHRATRFAGPACSPFTVHRLPFTVHRSPFTF